MPSSVVASFNYLTDSETLEVKYLSGIIYLYKGVPEKVYMAMKAAQSKGRFLNYKIKGKYNFEKVG